MKKSLMEKFIFCTVMLPVIFHYTKVDHYQTTNFSTDFIYETDFIKVWIGGSFQSAKISEKQEPHT